jgi:hypothetical protein
MENLKNTSEMASRKEIVIVKTKPTDFGSDRFISGLEKVKLRIKTIEKSIKVNHKKLYTGKFA